MDCYFRGSDVWVVLLFCGGLRVWVCADDCGWYKAGFLWNLVACGVFVYLGSLSFVTVGFDFSFWLVRLGFSIWFLENWCFVLVFRWLGGLGEFENCLVCKVVWWVLLVLVVLFRCALRLRVWMVWFDLSVLGWVADLWFWLMLVLLLWRFGVSFRVLDWCD